MIPASKSPRRSKRSAALGARSVESGFGDICMDVQSAPPHSENHIQRRAPTRPNDGRGWGDSSRRCPLCRCTPVRSSPPPSATTRSRPSARRTPRGPARTLWLHCAWLAGCCWLPAAAGGVCSRDVAVHRMAVGRGASVWTVLAVHWSTGAGRYNDDGFFAYGCQLDGSGRRDDIVFSGISMKVCL